MQDVSAFLKMGGYAGFVWPSYAIAAVVLIGLLLVSLRELRQRERRLAALESALPKRRRRGTSGDERSGA